MASSRTLASLLINGQTAYGNSSTYSSFLPVLNSQGVLDQSLINNNQYYNLTSNAITIDLSLGNYINLNLSGLTSNCTLNFVNVTNPGKYIFNILNGSPLHSLIFPSGTKQSGGGGNTYTSQNINNRDIIEAYYVNNFWLITIHYNFS